MRITLGRDSHLLTPPHHISGRSTLLSSSVPAVSTPDDRYGSRVSQQASLPHCQGRGGGPPLGNELRVTAVG